MLEEQREILSTRIMELRTNIEEIHARLQESGSEVLEGNERRELIHQAAALEEELSQSRNRMMAVHYRLRRFASHGRSEPAGRAEVRAPPGLWECAPPEEGS